MCQAVQKDASAFLSLTDGQNNLSPSLDTECETDKYGWSTLQLSPSAQQLVVEMNDPLSTSESEQLKEFKK